MGGANFCDCKEFRKGEETNLSFINNVQDYVTDEKILKIINRG